MVSGTGFVISGSVVNNLKVNGPIVLDLKTSDFERFSVGSWSHKVLSGYQPVPTRSLIEIMIVTRWQIS